MSQNVDCCLCEGAHIYYGLCLYAAVKGTVLTLSLPISQS